MQDIGSSQSCDVLVEQTWLKNVVSFYLVKIAIINPQHSRDLNKNFSPILAILHGKFCPGILTQPRQDRTGKTGRSVTDSGYARSDRDLERSNITFKENQSDGFDRNSEGLDYCIWDKLYGFRQTEEAVFCIYSNYHHIL